MGGAILVVSLSAGLAACVSPELPSPVASERNTPTAAADVPTGAAARSALGPVDADSFGNADFYTTVSGDTPAIVAGSFRISEEKLAEFNNLVPGAPLAPGTKLRLIPAPGPITGAKGTPVVDAKGIPTSYLIEAGDTLGGITYRFGLTEEQLAEANKVPYTYEKGNTYFVRAGKRVQLQKNPVDSRSGSGETVNNSFGHAVFYTTVDGDSFDSLGYKFRSSTDQLLQYNPALTADGPIRAGTRVVLTPAKLKIDGARGTFTSDADGIPLTYTTSAGDTERQIAFRFGVTDLRAANRPLTGSGGSWYAYADLPTGELLPGQTLSLSLDKPIHQ
ncbi:LysM peptidoglycan-binding domain-containing protein [Arthrobacter sp. Hor0625]|uniref:LysM peptidoglycan-binding domain-containing protein n=1 Tax=Arthrobacter sp. Hor0625 TaxID=3457358 RepID=UPI00403ECCE7